MLTSLSPHIGLDTLPPTPGLRVGRRARACLETVAHHGEPVQMACSGYLGGESWHTALTERQPHAQTVWASWHLFHGRGGTLRVRGCLALLAIHKPPAAPRCRRRRTAKSLSSAGASPPDRSASTRGHADPPRAGALRRPRPGRQSPDARHRQVSAATQKGRFRAPLTCRVRPCQAAFLRRRAAAKPSRAAPTRASVPGSGTPRMKSIWMSMSLRMPSFSSI